ncbi:MAG: peptidase E [Acidobacteria bacterium]|nr:peptidase E [Acidobacteriota bacterium]
MERREFINTTVIGAAVVAANMATEAAGPFTRAHRDVPAVGSGRATRKILIAGGGFGTSFIRYMAELTGKPRSKLCYLPTASADSPAGIIHWFRNCAPLNVEPSAQESFIASTQQSRSWEEVLLSVDGIVVSGGNTLNQQAIWKAQGIDVVLREAWDRGIVLGGASAGSLCWFEEGTTDSRPKELSTVLCLGFLKGSHSPHYDREPGRRPLYQKLIGSGEMKPGYACDNDAGIYFEDNEVARVVSTRAEAKVYYVNRVGNGAVERVLEPEQIAEAPDAD